MPKASTLTDAQKAAKAAEKAATFKKLASSRLANAEKAIGLLGNLANYKPSEAQRDFIFKRLADAAQAAHGRFSGTVQAATIEIPD